MNPNVDTEKLNKAALIIAKLLLRTREGKIQWKDKFTISGEQYSAALEDEISATVAGIGDSFRFSLNGPATPRSGKLADYFSDPTEILSISLSPPKDEIEARSPSGIVYDDLKELYRIASNPKSFLDDQRVKQVISFLDKLGG